MGNSEEDVLASTFWKHLTTKEKALHKQIEEHSLVVCAPITTALTRLGLVVNRTFFMNHVLRPSPFFKNQYESLNEAVTMEIDNEEILVHKSNNISLSPPFKIKVLSEELMYPSKSCKNKKPFRIFSINIPFNIVSNHAALEKLNDNDLVYPEVETVQAAVSFFNKWPENILVLRKFAKIFESFTQTYIPVPGYESHASTKINIMIEELMEALTITNLEFKNMYNTSPNLLIPIQRLVVAYSMGFLYEKIYTNICLPATRADDFAFQELLFAHTDTLKPSQLGLPPHLCISVHIPAETISHLPAKCSPGEKIHSIMLTMQQIKEAVNVNTLATSTGTAFITNDELIPLLGYVILRARLTNAFGNVFFLEYFSFIPNRAVSQEHFYVTSFKAAVEYLFSVLKELGPTTGSSSTSLLRAQSHHRSPKKTVPIPLALQQRTASMDSSSTDPAPIRRPLSAADLFAFNPYESGLFSEIPAATTSSQPAASVELTRRPSSTYLSAPSTIDLSDEFSSPNAFLI